NFRFFPPTPNSFNVINLLLQQPDGQLVIGGSFERLGPPPGALRYNLARVRLGATSAVTVTSAASFSAPIAPDSIATVFGTGLADATNPATAVPLPTTLAGVTLKLTDRLSVVRSAPLFFVSPAQLNLLVPPATAPGTATLSVELNGSTLAAGTINV